MIGHEDEPDRSAGICVAEIFGHDVRTGGAAVSRHIAFFVVDRFRAFRRVGS